MRRDVLISVMTMQAPLRNLPERSHTSRRTVPSHISRNLTAFKRAALTVPMIRQGNLMGRLLCMDPGHTLPAFSQKAPQLRRNNLIPAMTVSVLMSLSNSGCLCPQLHDIAAVDEGL